MNKNFNVPWRLYEEFVLDSEGSLIGQIEEMGGLEIARRIVASVNACFGISTERLEINAVNPEAGFFGSMAAKAELEAEELKKQRDELFDALRCFIEAENAVKKLEGK